MLLCLLLRLSSKFVFVHTFISTVDIDHPPPKAHNRLVTAPAACVEINFNQSIFVMFEHRLPSIRRRSASTNRFWFYVIGDTIRMRGKHDIKFMTVCAV